MAPMKFTELDCDQKNQLLDIAQQAIENGLAGVVEKPDSDTGEANPIVKEHIANFVSVSVRGQLRGCIGNLRPQLMLRDSIYHNAMSAAFADYRFKPLSKEDWPGLVVEISILSPLREIRVHDEEGLLRQLEPGKHGLLIEQALHRATFLPKVWASLPDKSQFLLELKRKAGMPDHGWSADIRCFLYTAQSFSRKIRE